MTMRLYDTAQAAVVDIELDAHVRMYVCGITPYDSTHLGHAATYLSYDLIIRRLEDLGHTVQLVRNVTDVDDSILPKARELGIDFLELAETEMNRFGQDMVALNTRRADSEPRATESMKDIIDLIVTLADRGHTYVSEGTTYFDITTFSEFGKLSHLTEQEMVELAAERGGQPDDPKQRNPLDFVLWQPSADDEPSWDSPFGSGRPGWHIECSAMSMRALGPALDIHGGGADLIFPHHECEIAQSESVNDEPFSKYWIHAGLVAYQGTKMSKSLGNLVFVSELRKEIDPRAIRLALMAHHYRSDFEWFDEEGPQAQRDLQLLVRSAGEADPVAAGPLIDQVRDALDDDLNTPRVHQLLLEEAQAIEEGAPSASPGGLVASASLCGIEL
ncbi:MAG TPA: cysteine--tRNA ligase [Acidimicrobiaceae bacterium]|nr:cysteine--tRNA ligase [Acidimicrobiaceae bacterium]HAX06176.1 cysteine--tRNA ligase [Acidimicrobiaceae bacterium]